MERDAFLRRVGGAVRLAEIPDVPDTDPGLLVPDLEAVDLVDRFEAALNDVGGKVHRGDPATVAVRVAAAHGAADYLSWDDSFLPAGVASALAGAGLRRLDSVVPPDRRQEHQQLYHEVALGVTGAEAGLAESGSIVVRSGPGRPRMASVIPTVHLAFLSPADIHRSLAHWASLHAGTIGDAANVVVITGVSRTGDIEMRLNTGVHGPAQVHVVLV